MITIKEKNQLLSQIKQKAENNQCIEMIETYLFYLQKVCNYEIDETQQINFGSNEIREILDTFKKTNEIRLNIIHNYSSTEDIQLKELLLFLKKDEIEIGEKNNQIIDIIITMKENETKRMIQPYQRKIDAIEMKYENQKNLWNENVNEQQQEFQQLKEKYIKLKSNELL